MTKRHQVGEPLASYVPMSVSTDVRGSLPALRRAAQRARQLAQQTGTDLIVMRDGRVVRVAPKPVVSN